MRRREKSITLYEITDNLTIGFLPLFLLSSLLHHLLHLLRVLVERVIVVLFHSEHSR